MKNYKPFDKLILSHTFNTINRKINQHIYNSVTVTKKLKLFFLADMSIHLEKDNSCTYKVTDVCNITLKSCRLGRFQACLKVYWGLNMWESNKSTGWTWVFILPQYRVLCLLKLFLHASHQPAPRRKEGQMWPFQMIRSQKHNVMIFKWKQ